MLTPNFIRKLHHKKTFFQVYNYITKRFRRYYRCADYASAPLTLVVKHHLPTVNATVLYAAWFA